MLFRWFRKGSVKRAARALHDGLAAASRDPDLFGPGRTPDTPDGRFEQIAAHAAILFGRLARRGDQAQETAQEVFDILFSGFDHALRELGVGDIHVGKRIRKLAESFYGRMAAYDAAFADPESAAALRSALARHILDAPDPDAPDADSAGFAAALAARILAWRTVLADTPDSALLAGEMPPPPALTLSQPG